MSERGEFNAELGDMCTGDFLIKALGQHVHTKREFLWCCPERDLSQDLVCERARHDEGRVTSTTAAHMSEPEM